MIAGRSVERLNDFRRRLERIAHEDGTPATGNQEILREFRRAMNNDLNVSEGLGVLFQWVRETNRRMDEESLSGEQAVSALEVLRRIDSVMGVVFGEEVHLSEEDKRLIREREEARKAEDWTRADEIREHFFKKGVRLEDTPQGTVAKPVIAGDEN